MIFNVVRNSMMLAFCVGVTKHRRPLANAQPIYRRFPSLGNHRTTGTVQQTKFDYRKVYADTRKRLVNLFFNTMIIIVIVGSALTIP